ncbi:MAG: hypothetical protein ACRDN0_08510, partial [Trebonia sp.]
MVLANIFIVADPDAAYRRVRRYCPDGYIHPFFARFVNCGSDMNVSNLTVSMRGIKLVSWGRGW